MKLVKGNLWDYHNENNIICITTNGTIKNNGELVMGRGCALEATQRYPEFPKLLGDLVKSYDNHCFFLPHRIVSFPVKYNWYETADLDLINRSSEELSELIDKLSDIRIDNIVIPRPGCGNGNLKWSEVEPIVYYNFSHDDRYKIIDKG